MPTLRLAAARSSSSLVSSFMVMISLLRWDHSASRSRAGPPQCDRWQPAGANGDPGAPTDVSHALEQMGVHAADHQALGAAVQMQGDLAGLVTHGALDRVGAHDQAAMHLPEALR